MRRKDRVFDPDPLGVIEAARREMAFDQWMAVERVRVILVTGIDPATREPVDAEMIRAMRAAAPPDFLKEVDAEIEAEAAK